MNVYKLKNIGEEITVRIELSDRFKEYIKEPVAIMKAELDLIETLRKGYSYGILNRYVLSNKELIKWINDEKLGGTILIADENDIESAERTIEANLVLQGDKEFFKGSKNNFYNKLENINPFGIESLNKVVFQKKDKFIRDTVVIVAIMIGSIDIFKLKSLRLGVVSVIIIGAIIGYIKLKDKKRIKKFIEFNQKRIDYSKIVYETKTGEKGKVLKYVTEKGKCYVREEEKIK